MLILFLFFASIIVFFFMHIILQIIFTNQLIKNFLISFCINFLILIFFVNEYELHLDHQILLYINIILAQFIYLIIVQSLRSSIQVYILNNYKKISVNNFKKEELKIFDYRIKNLIKNEIIKKKNDILKDNNKIILNITFYIFYFVKKIYKQRF